MFVTEAVKLEVALVSVETLLVSVGVEDEKAEVADVSVGVAAVKEELAYVSDAPPTVYVPTFEPFPGSFATRMFVTPDNVFTPAKYTFPKVSAVTPYP